MLVEVWSDVVCPWCYIGKRRFERALDRLAADPAFAVDVEVVYRPFQLDPTAPIGSSVPAAEAYARKFGGPEQAAAIIERVSAVAAAEGLEFRLDRARRANTRDAHRLLAYALRHGPAGAQLALAERLLRAYFTDGGDVGDHDVLVDAAADVGLAADAARDMLLSGDGLAELAADLDAAADAGITAVPTYVLDSRWAVPGAQDPDVFEQVLRRLAAAPAGG